MSTIALSRVARLRCATPSAWTVRPDTVTTETLTTAAGRTGDHVWSILTGHAPSSGSSLRGAAGRYRSSYDRSLRAVLARLAAAGVPSRREARGRRTVLLLGSLAGVCGSAPLRAYHAPARFTEVHSIDLLWALGYATEGRRETPCGATETLGSRWDGGPVSGHTTHRATVTAPPYESGAGGVLGHVYVRSIHNIAPRGYHITVQGADLRLTDHTLASLTVYLGRDACPPLATLSRGAWLPTDRPVADLCEVRP